MWFQSTHSLRSATVSSDVFGSYDMVSIHALLAECDAGLPCDKADNVVSIHALLAECDKRRGNSHMGSLRFNPRTPCGVRPFTRGRDYMLTLFQSTHSLRSATPHRGSRDHYGDCFNPRTPCGVRRAHIVIMAGLFRFQSTHSLRSATCVIPLQPCNRDVSIHALLAECDSNDWQILNLLDVSIHALLAECDTGQTVLRGAGNRFNPRTPCGVRQVLHPRIPRRPMFQSTHSLRSATLQR